MLLSSGIKVIIVLAFLSINSFFLFESKTIPVFVSKSFDYSQNFFIFLVSKFEWNVKIKFKTDEKNIFPLLISINYQLSLSFVNSYKYTYNTRYFHWSTTPRYTVFRNSWLLCASGIATEILLAGKFDTRVAFHEDSFCGRAKG